MWDVTCVVCLSFRLHHFPRCISQHVPDISLLLQTGVSQPDLQTAPTTQTPRRTTMPHTSSIFHSRMKYAWMCARHLPSLGLCSPQEARLICNWEVCWINQQFICVLIEITLSKKTLLTQRTTPLILPISSFAYCQFSSVCSLMACWDSGKITVVMGIRKKYLYCVDNYLDTQWRIHLMFWFRFFFLCVLLFCTFIDITSYSLVKKGYARVKWCWII